MRLTKITCTIGPASCTKKQIKTLAQKGMAVARLNFSHGTREWQKDVINSIRELNAEGFCIATMLDTKGAEIRTGDRTDPIPIKKGQEVIFSPYEIQAKEQVILVSYDSFAQDVLETDRILLDNGEMSFEILSSNPKNKTVRARAQQNGTIGSRRHLNLPGADIDLPSITKSDWKDIEFGIQQKLDFVALSFIRNAKEVEEVRKLLKKKKSSMQIISKIETKVGVNNLDSIIEASDGIMVARGDLGADIPYETLPAVQDEMVVKCRAAGKPVIVATHMLESMIHHAVPTRAEVTDVAHAAVSRADSTMLSGETAAGIDPAGATDAMSRILLETERYHFDQLPIFIPAAHGEGEARGQAACSLAASTKAAAILIFTNTGTTARYVAKFRPAVPIIAFTPFETIQRQMNLLYGVTPHALKFSDKESAIQKAIGIAVKGKLLKKGDTVILLSDSTYKSSIIRTLQIRTV